MAKVIYRAVIRPLLFALPAEFAHQITLAALRIASRSEWLMRGFRWALATHDPLLEVTAFGLRFRNPVGLAAGLDKDAQAFEAFGALGFGFVEVGTLTAQPQPGNPRPRLFRLPRDRALINRMGFNNRGVQAAVAKLAEARLQGKQRRTVLGINIGKTKLAPNEHAADDYGEAAAAIARYADYVAVNVSSPNTPGLRDLQTVPELRRLLTRIRSELDAAEPTRRVPLLLKIAPDLADDDIDAIATLAIELRLEGIIATNTTTRREGLATARETILACGDGGLSGPPVKARALAVLARLRARVGTHVTLVAVGGIETVDDAWERICAGASLVQIYTALIYEGPLLARRIALGLARRAQAAGFANIAAAVGSASVNRGRTSSA
jgi:dihydroorotate dehydrogenase